MRRTIITVIIVAAAMIAAAIYFTYDPNKSGNLFPKCIFLTFTGFKCPGCGSQRAIHSLLHGDLVQAFHYNAALIAGIPALAVFALSEWKRLKWPRFYNIINNKWVGISILVATIAWWILRNVFDW